MYQAAEWDEDGGGDTVLEAEGLLTGVLNAAIELSGASGAAVLAGTGVGSRMWRRPDLVPEVIENLLDNLIEQMPGGVEPASRGRSESTAWRVHVTGDPWAACTLVLWGDPKLAAGAKWETLAAALDEVIDNAVKVALELERVHGEARTDPLTGLVNRRGMADGVRRLAGRRAQDGDVSVAVLDVDAMKAVNDRLSHAAGDRLLRAIGRAVRRTLRSQDTGARTGGDEFLLLLPGATALAARDVVERVRARLIDELDRELLPYAGLSAGVACVMDGGTIEDAVRRADAALYQAKREDPGTTRVAPSLHVRSIPLSRPERVLAQKSRA